MAYVNNFAGANINRTVYSFPSYQPTTHEIQNTTQIDTTNTICTFCQKSGETYVVFSTHSTRDPITQMVTCPKLRSTRCLHCGELGHTKKYCNTPILQPRSIRRKTIDLHFDNEKFFCTFCKNAGESIQTFTSHNLRDKTQKTTCPKLLATKCRKCKELGHTEKYCTQPLQVTTSAIKRTPVVYEDFVTDVVLVDPEDINTYQEEQYEHAQWPCVGGCGEKTNGSQYCCRTYCSDPQALTELTHQLLNELKEIQTSKPDSYCAVIGDVSQMECPGL